MKALRKCFLVMMVIVLATAGANRATAAVQEPEEGILVGRIAHVEGQLLRYVPEEKDWVATVKDAPFGLEDSLYSEASGKAEFTMPNNTWIRIGGSTQIQLITLRTDVTEVDIGSGMARCYNRSSEGVIRATSPFGYVVAPADTVFDLYVGDRSLEVIALKGKVDFVIDRDQTRYEVKAGGPSVVSDGQQVTSGQGNVDADWDDWNNQRDQLWSKRAEVRGESVRYLPPALRDEAHDLDENGRWEQVYHEGQYRRFWRPRVAAGWAPYTAGRWSVYYGDNCWIPSEPFGYVTHHYGNWLFMNNYNCWYWAPPVVGIGLGPLLGFGWYPGRVGWMYSGWNLGWFPLAPYEPYYCHRRWGPRCMMVNNVNINNININRYRYFNRAVVVNQKDFYGVNNYQKVKIDYLSRNTIVKEYRGAPVIGKDILYNYDDRRDKYNLTDARVDHKPHDTVMSRIAHNEQVRRSDGNISARTIEQHVAGFNPGKPLDGGNVEAPSVTNKLVPPQDANRPTNELPKQELRAKPRAPSPIVGGPGREIESQPGRAGTDQRAVAPAPGRASRGTGDMVSPPTSRKGSPATDVTGAGKEGERGPRVRPPRPGQDQQTVEPGQRKQVGEPGTAVRPPKAVGEGQPSEQGGVPSPLDSGRRVRQPRLQQDQQAPGGGQAGSAGGATGQSPRLRAPQPGSAPAGDQSNRTGTAPGNGRQERTFKGGRDTQSPQPEGGTIQAPSSGNQRTVPSGGGREYRAPAARPVSPPAEGNRNGVMPQVPSQPQGSVAPSRQFVPPPQRAPRQREPVVQPQEQPPANGTATPQGEAAPGGGGHWQRGGGEGQSRGRW